MDEKIDWKWPEWLNAKYIAMDQCGTWRAFANDKLYANKHTGCWQSGSFSMPLPKFMVAFEPPFCLRDKWEYSLTANPRDKRNQSEVIKRLQGHAEHAVKRLVEHLEALCVKNSEVKPDGDYL